ncbi:hypothetical protein [Flavobacterium pedocola]
MDNENFIAVDYCLEADTFYSGKYTIEKDKVLLKFNTTVIQKEYKMASDFDTIASQPDYVYKTEKHKPFQSALVKFSCKEKICLKTTGKEPEYASEDKAKTPESFLKELKKEGLLEKLNSN